MGVLSRFSEIMKANINDIIDKMEDPAKMVDQTLRNLREDLAEVKKETAGVMAEETRVKREYDECTAEIAKVTSSAQAAVKAGNDDDAKALIAKKQSLETKQASLKQALDVASDNATKVRQMHDKLVKDIDDLEGRKDAIKAKVAVAKTQQHINDINVGTKTASSISSFERMEAKANNMLDRANAEAELNASETSTDDLVKKYSSGSDASVEDELAKMKAELGVQ